MHHTHHPTAHVYRLTDKVFSGLAPQCRKRRIWACVFVGLFVVAVVSVVSVYVHCCQHFRYVGVFCVWVFIYIYILLHFCVYTLVFVSVFWCAYAKDSFSLLIPALQIVPWPHRCSSQNSIIEITRLVCPFRRSCLSFRCCCHSRCWCGRSKCTASIQAANASCRRCSRAAGRRCCRCGRCTGSDGSRRGRIWNAEQMNVQMVADLNADLQGYD